MAAVAVPARFRARVWKTGNSLVVTVPHWLVKLLELEEGDSLELELVCVLAAEDLGAERAATALLNGGRGEGMGDPSVHTLCYVEKCPKCGEPGVLQEWRGIYWIRHRVGRCYVTRLIKRGWRPCEELWGRETRSGLAEGPAE